MSSSLASSSNSTFISEIYKSRTTILEQLSDRGFDISDYEGFSIHEINIMNTNEQLDILVTHPETKHKVYVKYHLNKLLRENNIYEAADTLFELENTLNKETDQLLFVIKSRPNDTHRKIMNDIWNTEGIFTSIIDLGSLQYNILTHSLVPKHRVMTDESEIKELEVRFNIETKSQFPEISRFDPVAIVIGLRPGQLVEITRVSSTAIYSKYYRLCY